MESDNSVVLQGNSLLDSANLHNMNSPNSPISNNTQHQDENGGDVSNLENAELISSSESNTLALLELAPENDLPAVTPPDSPSSMSRTSSSSLDSSSESDVPDFEPDTATVGNSTVTNLPIVSEESKRNNRDKAIVIGEPQFDPEAKEKKDLGDQMMMLMNIADQRNNAVNYSQSVASHHFGSMMCPALSEAVQVPNYASAGQIQQGSYGEQLRSMANNNWSGPVFSGFQNFPSLNPPANVINIPNPITTYAPFFSASPAPMAMAGTSSGNRGLPYEQSSVIQALIQSFKQYQNACNILENYVPLQALEPLAMPGIGQSSNQMLQNMINTNQQPILPQSTIMTSAGLDLSNLSFTQLMSACDMMSSTFSDYWIKQQLTDNYQPQIPNNPVGFLANNNVFREPNRLNGHSVTPLSSAQTFSSTYQGQQQMVIRDSLSLPNQAPQNAMVPNNNPRQLELVLNNVTRPVPRRRRSSLSRPAFFSRPQTGGLRLRRSVASAASNNNGANSSDVQILNSQTVIQAGDTDSQSNGRATQEQVNLRGKMVDIIPIKFPTVGRLKEPAAESSASSSKRSRRQVLVRGQFLANSPVAGESENTQANIMATRSEENSNDVDENSIGSSTQSEELRSNRLTNGVYDPEFERMGLPIDPFLRMFVMSDWNKKGK